MTDTATGRSRLLTISETAEILGCSRRTVYKLFEDGTLVRLYVRPGAPRVSEDDLAAYIESLRNGAA